VCIDAHARLSMHGAAVDTKDIDYILYSEHECALLILWRLWLSFLSGADACHVIYAPMQ
jgi:hypothetical protein